MSYYNRYSGVQSPPRRPIIQPSATSPFCTSPSQLQEVTLDPDGTFNYAAGLHSPNGGPMRGRSIKEFEESLTALRKENFNLKLRIYFLEERMGTNFSMDKENAIKKNIELKVEVESLKKELAEKQELLCQAVKAMELDEDEHKKDSDEQQKTILRLQKELDALQMKIDEEGRCQGDRGYDEEYYEAFNIPQKDCGHEAYLQELETKVKDLEAMLSNEKESVRELENLLQLTDNRNLNIASLDEEVKQKDISIRKLQADLDERTKVVANYRVRVNKLEDDLIERKNDIDYVTKQLKEKCLLVQELQNESEELHKLLSESQSSLSSERRKNEKHKISVHDRNKRIMELEEEVNQLTKKLTVIQTQYDSIKSEVQRKHDVGRRTPIANTDLSQFSVRDTPKQNVSRGDDNVQSAHQTSLPQLRLSMSPSTPIQRNRSPKSSSRSPLETSSSSNAVDVKDLNIDQLQKEVVKSRKHIVKLEQEQLKACRIIQTMLETRKRNGKEIGELKSLVSKKDDEIGQLSGKIGKYFNKDGDGVNIGAQQSRTLAKITELNPDNTKDNETTAEAYEDPKLLLEQYKELTDSLEEQKQVLLCTLEETRNQLQDVESKFANLQTEIKSRDNRIVDLEFEMLSLSQDIANNEAGEKSDVGNEKPTAFFIKEIEDKDREIEKLEMELRKRTADLQAIVNKELWDKNRDIEKLQKRFNDIIVGKDEEINSLERIVGSKNMQLEVIKKKICELGMNVEEYEDSIQIIADQNHDIKTLQEKLQDSQQERDFFKVQLAEYDNKLRVASDQMMADSHRYRSLESEYYQIREELDKCERLRQDANEMCSVLCKRLEELAYFLDSLLKHKSVLGYLGSKKNDKLRALVNQTLDISRTLSLSMSLNPDQSLLQLSNISAVLNSSHLEEIAEGKESISELCIAPIEASLTYTSHFSQQQLISNNDDAKVIAALRAQVENLKKEIELRDTEASYAKEVSYISKLSVMKIENANKDDEDIMNVLMSLGPEAGRVQSHQQIYDTLVCAKFNGSSEKSTTTIKYNADQNSESEAWSEPDRNVSRARIGLDDTASSRKSVSEPASTEDEDKTSTRSSLNRKTVLAESRQTIINLHAQVAELESKLKVREMQLVENSEAAEDAARYLRDERLKVERLTTERYELLEKIEETEQNLRLAEAAKCNANDQLLELQNTIEEVQTSQLLLQNTLEIKNKETQNRINQLEQEKEQLNQHMRELQQIADEAKIDFIASEKKLNLMRKEMEYLEESIRTEVRAEWEQKLRTQEQNYEIKTKLIEHTAEAQIKKMNEQNLELLSKFEAECKNRVEVENLMETIKELEKFKQLVNVAEERIHSLEEQEESLRLKLEESESNYRAKVSLLHEELEKINLNYSETVLEKSRILTEKAELDCQLKEFVTKEAEFARQVREYKDDFANMKETFQKQVAHLEHQKSKLEVRVSVLEQQNAELKNKLVKLQAGDNESGKITPTTTSSRILELFLNKTVPPSYKSRQYDHMDDQVTVYSVPTVETTGPMDLERMQATSSPDLGIESDHGRFSSLEAPATSQSRPFLKTLELTESMSNLLNNENEKQLANCNNEQCCEKTKEIVNENNDLRKKLLRTRKALEDTVGQLTVANQRKKQVEKTICKQIHKTSQVLRKAKANLDSGSDQDVLKK